MRTFELTQNYYCFAAGTILKEDINGNYYVSMADETYLEARFIGSIPKINGAVVHSHPDVFREVHSHQASGRLLLESKRADVGIENGGSVEFWRIRPERGNVLVMSYCPENDSPGNVHEMEFEDAVDEWSRLCEEGWEVIAWTERADQLMQRFPVLATCASCGYWAKPDEYGDCVLCDGPFELA